MTDLILHGVLNAPYPDDPSEIDIVTWVQFRERAREASARLQALEAMPGVVKPLVWEGFWASSPYGPYSIYEGFQNESGSWCACWSGSVVAHAHSAEQAKAAAQADYERRILSAFTTPPADAPQARVKKIQWEEGYPHAGIEARAAGAGGRVYRVEHYGDGDYHVFDNVGGHDCFSGRSATLEGAKDLAECHHEMLIADWQLPSPADAKRAEFLAKVRDGDVLATEGAEARYIEDGENACPACGGSGHKGDAADAKTAINHLPEIDAISSAATPGEWTAHNMVHAEGRPMTPEEIGEYVTNSVKLSEETRFLFISGDNGDGDVDVCHIGNGPKGPHNAALIVALVNAYRSGQLAPADAIAEAVKTEREACALTIVEPISAYIYDVLYKGDHPITSHTHQKTYEAAQAAIRARGEEA